VSGRFTRGGWRRKRQSEFPRAPRLYGLLNSETAISDSDLLRMLQIAEQQRDVTKSEPLLTNCDSRELQLASTANEERPVWSQIHLDA